MKRIRIGNDISIAWAIMAKDGRPFELNKKGVSLYLKNYVRKEKLHDFSIEGNVITWVFYGKEQKNTGTYSLELVLNEDAKHMVTTDVCDFVQLVACSCKEGGEDNVGVITESIELTSVLENISTGGGLYDDTEIRNAIAVLDVQKVDKENGKGLSSEDFTPALKTKLEGLSNYDDTQIAKRIQEVEADIPTKVSQLENDRGYLTEHQDISNLASKNDLARKQDVISDLATIRSGASKGATALQSIPSEYVTENELNAKGYATTSQVNAKQDTISDRKSVV